MDAAPETSPRTSPWPALLLFAVAFALYACTLRDGTFSDAVQLAERVAGGPTPYYNVLYLPVGWLFHQLVGALSGGDVYHSLQWLSASCGALGVAVVVHALGRATEDPVARGAWGLFLAVTPGVWFFSTSVEVHALQFLAVAFATALALHAREAPRGRAFGIVLVALLTALLGHLSAVLVVPALVVLAWGVRPGHGLGRSGLSWRGLALGAVGVAALGWGVSRAFDAAGRKNPLETLRVFGDFLWARIQDGGWFSVPEVLAFLEREYVAPAALLAPLILCAPFVRRERLGLVLACAGLPYFVVLPQGGVREEGAYYLSLYPLVVYAAARLARGLPRAVLLGGLALAIAAQAWLGWQRVGADGGGEDAREWAHRIAAACPAGSVVYTVTLPRWHALSQLGKAYDSADLRRLAEMSPRSAWGRYAEMNVAITSAHLAAGRRVFVDADLYDEERRPAALAHLEAVLSERLPGRRPWPAGASDPLVFELSLE